MSRLAALAFLRLCTSTSRTKPSWSTARHSQCFVPATLTTTSSRCHLSPKRPADRRRISIGEVAAELLRPCPDRLVGDDDAAGRQHVLDHAQAEREAEVQPHCMRDDLGGKTMAAVERITGNLRHASLIAQFPHLSVNFTVPSSMTISPSTTNWAASKPRNNSTSSGKYRPRGFPDLARMSTASLALKAMTAKAIPFRLVLPYALFVRDCIREFRLHRARVDRERE